jgi:hypothetical protein
MIVHFKRETSPWTLCGSARATNTIEGGTAAEELFLWFGGRREALACPICLRRLEDPAWRPELPTFEFTEVFCRRCEDFEDHIERVAIAAKIHHGTGPAGDEVAWARCVRCGSTDPCCDREVLEQWAAERERTREEMRQRGAGL